MTDRKEVPDTGAEEAKLPPQAPEIEQAILGAALYTCEQGMAEVSDILTPEMFYVHAHRVIYAAMSDMYENGHAVDQLTVTQRLHDEGTLDIIGGAFYVSQLTSKVSGTSHLEYWCFIVAQKYMQREAIRIANDIGKKAGQDDEDVFDTITQAQEKLEATIADRIKRRSITYAEGEKRALENMDKPKKPRHTTGFDGLDKTIGGYMPGDLIIVGARPGQGKSSFMFSSAFRGADRKSPNAIMSMELTEEVAQARMFSARSGVPLMNAIRGELSPGEIDMRHRYMQSDLQLPLYMKYGSGLAMSDVKAEATRLKRRYNIGALFIDQLNWITLPKKMSRDEGVGVVTRGLRRMAQDLDIAVIIAHQLNREVEKRGGDKRPQLSDLRDSGNIEQDIQVAMFLYRPEYYKITEFEHGSTIGLMEVIVAKNSNGPLGSSYLRFQGHTASVHDDFFQGGGHTPYGDDNPFG